MNGIDGLGLWKMGFGDGGGRRLISSLDCADFCFYVTVSWDISLRILLGLLERFGEGYDVGANLRVV